MAHGSTAVAFEYGKSKTLCFTELRPIDAKGLIDDPDCPGRSFGWLHVARVGEWKGHPKGPFEFTHELFDEIVRNNQKRITPVNADYEHQSRNYDSNGPKWSSGEVMKVELRDGGENLYAYMHWTPPATTEIRNYQYRTCSPVIAFKAIDRVTGEDIGADLVSVALTNDPFQDGLEPIQLTWTAAMSETSPAQQKAAELAAKALKEKAMADASDAYDKTQELANKPPEAEKTAEEKAKEAEAAKSKELADAPPATVAEVEGEVSPDASAVLAAIADKSGLALDDVIGRLMDNLSKIIPILTGTPDGSTSDSMPMTARTNEVMALELRATESKVLALSNQVASLTAAAKKRDDADKAAEAKRVADAKAAAVVALTDKVKALQLSTHVGPSEQDFADAVELFTLAPEAAARRYAQQIVPLSVDLSGADPRGNASTETVSLAGMNEAERAGVRSLMAVDKSEQDAIQIVALMRDGTTGAVEAAKIVAAKSGGKVAK